MHVWMRSLLAGLVALAAVVVVPAASTPAGAQGSNCGCVTIQCVMARSAGLEGNLECAWDQYNELNRYDREPEICSEQNRADPGRLSYTGTVRWVLIATDINAAVRDRLGADSGLAYNRVCVPDAGYQEDIAPTIYETRVFEDITPETLAMLAMDQFFLGLDAPDPSLTPEPVTLVNVDTWLSVDNIPVGELTSPTISVPGPPGGGPITVYAVAEATHARWEMGDGSEPFTCPIHEAAEPPVCNTYSYERSSAGEPQETYRGTVSIVWIGRYFVNGVEQPDELPVPQQASFEIQVAEAQALNTSG
jgi:hypothetical protein